jgi:hypothetical protein
VNGDVVQSLWDEHVGWSKTADRLKSRRGFWRTTVLSLTIVGAASQTFAAAVTAAALRLGAGVLGTLALAAAPFLTGHFLTADETRKWLRARSVSEGIKSEIFAYRAGAEPYTGPDALAVLHARVRQIRNWASSLEAERAITGSPSEPAPGSLDPAAYIRVRVRQQVDEYYRPKARRTAVLAARFRWAEIALTGIAAALGALATSELVSVKLGPWVAVLTTVAGAVAAHAAANRYDFEATTFYATAKELSDLEQDWQLSGQSAPGKAWSDFVRACEHVISAENRGWMAKLDETTRAAA